MVIAQKEKDALIRLAQDMALAAAEAILSYTPQDRLSYNIKEDMTPVTLADRQAEQIMRDILARSRPADGILGEELLPYNSNSPYQWIFDPIDGTKSFLTGKPLFTTLIACYYQLKPLLGLIYQPISREMWWGQSAQNTVKNGREIFCSSCQDLSQAILQTTSPLLFSDTEKYCFDRVARQCRYCEFGGDAYGYALLASGSVDLVIEAGLKPYDYAALIPVIEGAGGIITDWQGDRLPPPGATTPPQNICAAANQNLHQAALSCLQSSSL